MDKHEDMAIERKTWYDFCHSVDGRLWNQMIAMGGFEDAQPYILIEGNPYVMHKYRGWNKTSVMGVVTAIVLDFKIPVFYAHDVSWTIALMKCWHNKLGSAGPKHIRIRPRPKLRDEQFPRYLTEGLPGVGPAMAKKLLTRFITFKAIVNATEEELIEIDGMGKKTATAIVDVINRE